MWKHMHVRSRSDLNRQRERERCFFQGLEALKAKKPQAWGTEWRRGPSMEERRGGRRGDIWRS